MNRLAVLALFAILSISAQCQTTRYIDRILSNDDPSVDVGPGLRINGSAITIDGILDEDNMASDSATSLATQQSIKAYVDASTDPNMVTNAGTSTDNGIARFDGTTGKIVQDSGVTIDDFANITTTGHIAPDALVGGVIDINNGTNPGVSLVTGNTFLSLRREDNNAPIVTLSSNQSTWNAAARYTQNQSNKSVSVLQFGDSNTGINYEFATLNSGVSGMYFLGRGNQLMGVFEDGNISYVPMEFQGDISMSGTGQLDLPVGTTAQRSSSPSSGMVRFNSDTSSFEGFDGAAWGSLGGGSGKLDIFGQEEYESSTNALSFTCGTNFAASDNTTTQISGTKSIDFTQGATPPAVGVECVGPGVTLEPRQIESFIGVTFYAKNDGATGDVDFVVYDEDGVELVRIPIEADSSSNGTKHEGFFNTLSTSTEIRYELEVQVQNANAVITLDDIELTTNPLAVKEIFASSDLEFFTPDLDNDGTTNRAEGTWSRIGPYAFVSVTMQYTGTGLGSTLRFDISDNLPFDVDLTKITGSSFYNSYSAGMWYDEVGGLGGAIGVTLDSAGDIIFTKRDSNLVNGSNLGNLDRFTFHALFPVAGWSDKVQGVAVKGSSVNSIANTNDIKFFYDQTAGTVVDQFDNSYSVVVSGSSSEVKTIDISSLALANRMICTGGSVNFQTVQYAPSSTNVSIVINQFIPNTAVGTDDDFTIDCTRFKEDYIRESERTIVFEGGLYSERLEGEATANVTSAAGDTFYDCTGASVSLPRGSWEVCYSGYFFSSWISGSNTHIVQSALRDGSNTLVADSTGLLSFTLAAATDNNIMMLSNCSKVSPTSTTTYKLSFKTSSSPSAAISTCRFDNFSGSISGDDDLSTKVWAKRVQ